MKKIRVIERERIINPKTGRLHDDAGLTALDGYYEHVFEVDETYYEIKFIHELEKKYPELKGRSFEISKL